jgi:hypothetical protein
VLDERFIGRAGVFAYDPLRLAVDVRGLAVDGHELARMLREIAPTSTSSWPARTSIVGVFGMGEPAAPLAERFVAGASRSPEHVGLDEGGKAAERFAPAPPWGELVMTPREAFLGRQESVPAARRSAASPPSRSRPTRPGSPTCCPASASRPRRSTTSSARSSSAAACAARATACCAQVAMLAQQRRRGLGTDPLRAG